MPRNADWQKPITRSPYSIVSKKRLTWWRRTSMGLHGGANQAAIIDPSAPSRKPLPTRAYLFRRAPHRCGDQGMCQANGLTYAGFLNHRDPRTSGRFVCMVPSQSPASLAPPRSVGPHPPRQCATGRSRIAG